MPKTHSLGSCFNFVDFNQDESRLALTNIYDNYKWTSLSLLEMKGLESLCCWYFDFNSIHELDVAIMLMSGGIKKEIIVFWFDCWPQRWDHWDDLREFTKDWGTTKSCCVKVDNASAYNVAISYFICCWWNKNLAEFGSCPNGFLYSLIHLLSPKY